MANDMRKKRSHTSRAGEHQRRKQVRLQSTTSGHTRGFFAMQSLKTAPLGQI
jgi:hypothetical protein